MHQIQHLVYPYKKSKNVIVKECSKIADEHGDYKGQINGIDFKEIGFVGNYEKAVDYIQENDKPYYNFAIPFKGPHGKQLWLVKIEYHC